MRDLVTLSLEEGVAEAVRLPLGEADGVVVGDLEGGHNPLVRSHDAPLVA